MTTEELEQFLADRTKLVRQKLMQNADKFGAERVFQEAFYHGAIAAFADIREQLCQPKQ